MSCQPFIITFGAFCGTFILIAVGSFLRFVPTGTFCPMSLCIHVPFIVMGNCPFIAADIAIAVAGIVIFVEIDTQRFKAILTIYEVISVTPHTYTCINMSCQPFIITFGAFCGTFILIAVGSLAGLCTARTFIPMVIGIIFQSIVAVRMCQLRGNLIAADGTNLCHFFRSCSA